MQNEMVDLIARALAAKQIDSVNERVGLNLMTIGKAHRDAMIERDYPGWIDEAKYVAVALTAAPPPPTAQPGDGRVEAMREALRLALGYLIANEPGDSRAVSDEFVAMAAVEAGCANAECLSLIAKALTTQGASR